MADTFILQSPVNIETEFKYPLSATTETQQKEAVNAYTKKNEEILKQLKESDTEKDDNQIMGESIEKQIDEKGGGFSETIREMAICPCCSEYYMGNVMQCTNGHCVCEGCRDKLKECPMCKTPYGKIKSRNLTTETLLTKLNFTVPCAYQSLGCTESVPYSNIHDHWRKCQFRPLECFYGTDCGFKAKDIGAYVEHLCSVHGFIPTDTPGIDFFQLNISNMASLIASNSYNSSQVANYVHQYNDDYLLIQVTNMSSVYNYVITVYSLAKNYYIFKTTIQAPNVMYSNEQEFAVQSIDMLEKLYTKRRNSQQFYDHFRKYLGWHSASLSYNKIIELASYPMSHINCNIRNPSANELKLFTALNTDLNVLLMENPVEESLTQSEVDAIVSSSEGFALPPLVGGHFYQYGHDDEIMEPEDEE